ncbi:MAG: T9SS type A sorting domain-containing protein [Candidatus Krumholzibacteriota bacterium]|nr:T9SS type A sorting domain-containing protein [Candidatus Krumholzibacteriota bacterium]
MILTELNEEFELYPHIMLTYGWQAEDDGSNFKYHVMDPRYTQLQTIPEFTMTCRLWTESLVVNNTYEITGKNIPLALAKSFSAIEMDLGIMLTLETESESNSDMFRFDRRSPGSDRFRPVTVLHSKGKTTGARYRWLDRKGNVGDIYRIIEIEEDGRRGVLAVTEALTPEQHERSLETPIIPVAPAPAGSYAAGQPHSDAPSRESLSIVPVFHDWIAIYPDSFSAAIAPLVSWRESNGMDAEGFTTEFIVGTYGMSVDDFIEAAWSSPGHCLQYVTIVGDGETVIPIDGYDDGPTTDNDWHLYESDVGLGDVDDDGLCDLAIGRIPARSVSDVVNYVSKVIEYESNPAGAWADTVSCFVWAVDDNHCSGALADSLATEVCSSIPPSLSTHYYSATDSNLATYDYDTRMVISSREIGAGKSLVFGYGTDSNNVHFVNWNYRNNLDDFDDHHPYPFMVTACCEAANIFSQYPASKYIPNFLFHPTRGVIGVFAPTGATHQVGNYHLSTRLMDYLYNRGAPSTGYACMHAQRQVMEQYPPLVSTARSYIFIGDPALRIAGSVVCDNDYSVDVVLDANSDIYEIGDAVTINWTCSGCPWKVTVKLSEHDSETQTLATFDQYETPDLKTGSMQWTAEGINAPYEDHTYSIHVEVQDLAHNLVTGYSRTFEIVEEIPAGKPDPRPVISLSGDDGTDKRIPLPGIEIQGDESSFDSYCLLPDGISIDESRFEIGIEAPAQLDCTFDAIELIVADVAADQDSGAENGASPDILARYAGRANEGEESTARFSFAAPLFHRKSMNIRASGTVSLAFSIDGPNEGNERRYILHCTGMLKTPDSGTNPIPTTLALGRPYPNPFNPSTVIEYELPKAAPVNISIYDTQGRLIKTLVNEHVSPGSYSVTWNGKNASNNFVTSGVYYCRITVDGRETITRKLVLLR